MNTHCTIRSKRWLKREVCNCYDTTQNNRRKLRDEFEEENTWGN